MQTTPESMTAPEQRSEVAGVLAAGILRLKKRQSTARRLGVSEPMSIRVAGSSERGTAR